MAYSNAWIYQITANGLERVCPSMRPSTMPSPGVSSMIRIGQVERVLASESDENKKGELFDEDS